MILLFLLTPLLALLSSFVYALILFWPTMIILGALHSWVLWVPALGAAPTFLALALVYLIIPLSSSSKD